YVATGAQGQTDVALVTITVTNTQDPPVAWVDVTGATDGVETVVSPLDNDLDDEDDPLVLVDVGAPSHGTAVDAGDGTVTYTPTPGFRGIDFFGYHVADAGGGGTDAGGIAVGVDSIEMVLTGTGSAGLVRLADDSVIALDEAWDGDGP